MLVSNLPYAYLTKEQNAYYHGDTVEKPQLTEVEKIGVLLNMKTRKEFDQLESIFDQLNVLWDLVKDWGVRSNRALQFNAPLSPISLPTLSDNLLVSYPAKWSTRVRWLVATLSNLVLWYPDELLNAHLKGELSGSFQLIVAEHNHYRAVVGMRFNRMSFAVTNPIVRTKEEVS